jgi:hypothetical protein
MTGVGGAVASSPRFLCAPPWGDQPSPPPPPGGSSTRRVSHRGEGARDFGGGRDSGGGSRFGGMISSVGPSERWHAPNPIHVPRLGRPRVVTHPARKQSGWPRIESGGPDLGHEYVECDALFKLGMYFYKIVVFGTFLTKVRNNSGAFVRARLRGDSTRSGFRPRIDL